MISGSFKVHLLSLILLSSTCIAALAQGGSGLFSDLDVLEKRFQAPGDPAAPMVSRLAALELRIFGSPRSGSLVERMQSIRSAANDLGNRQAGAASPQNSGSPSSTAQQSLPGSTSTGALPSPTPGASADTSIIGAGWVPTSSQPVKATNNGPAKETATVEPSWKTAPHHPGKPVAPKIDNSPLPVSIGALTRTNFPPDALPLLNAFPPNVVHMEQDSSAIIAKPDYYAEVHKASKGKAIRFKNMPIPVYIQPYPDKAFVHCVLGAFESWELRSDGKIKFAQIENPNQARIQVIWKRLGANKDNAGCLLGAHTILKYTNRGNGSLSLMSVGAVPVPIYIPRMGPKYTVPPQVMEVNLDLITAKDLTVRDQCLQAIVTHELGHALGLLGHSPNVADIMYPITDEHSRLSQRDLNTVIKLYDQKCDIPL